MNDSNHNHNHNHNQFGIQLAGAKAPIYIVASFETIDELRTWLCYGHGPEPLVEVMLVGHTAKSCLIGRDHIVAVSGPNNPSVVEIFKS